MSISGTITQENEPRTVIIRKKNQPATVKDITVSDDTDHVKVTLWKEAAKSPIKTGDFVKITNVYKPESSYGSEPGLGTTESTIITKIEKPAKTEEIEFIAISTDNTDTVVLVANDMEEYRVSKDVLVQTVLQAEDDIDDIEDAMITLLPIHLEITHADHHIQVITPVI
ncbi:uncharacterized protein LOC135495771 [Lineus longissimus]|uniref:uncharacterized protein LOC135495771 n=1 Tax=Lineus longissimus TaxID=88925 RepID=UPI002B4D799C